jgi:hypothetical protein
MSDNDSAKNCENALATCEYYGHVLNRYADTDLRAVLDISGTIATRIRGAPSKCSTYKEVQIHGPVSLATDVEALSVPGKEDEANSELKRIVKEFQMLSGCNVMWQGDLLGL